MVWLIVIFCLVLGWIILVIEKDLILLIVDFLCEFILLIFFFVRNFWLIVLIMVSFLFVAGGIKYFWCIFNRLRFIVFCGDMRFLVFGFKVFCIVICFVLDIIFCWIGGLDIVVVVNENFEFFFLMSFDLVVEVFGISWVCFCDIFFS